MLSRSLLLVKDSVDERKDQLKWKWKKGDETVQADLDDPFTTATYTLCVYDTSGGVPSLVSSLAAAPSPLWVDKDPKGWQHKDKAGFSDGVQRITLRPGAAGRSQVQVKAKGVNVPMPAPFSATEFFDQDPEVTVQLSNSDTAACWTSTFTAAKMNTVDRFKAVWP